MQYLSMRPEQVRDAVKRQVPVAICAGSVEYHGPHLPLSTDLLIPQAVIERVEKKCECIVMPPLPFSPTYFWAAGPADGEFNFDPVYLENYAFEIFKGLLAVGFRRIYVVQHHQGSYGLPHQTIATAAGRAVWEVCSGYENGWGRVKGHEANKSLSGINMCEILTFSDPEEGKKCPIGHGGKGETQLVLAHYPDMVDMERLNYFSEANEPLPSWLADSRLATKEEGDYWLDFCAAGYVREFSKKN
jgi:creatinine amidohydrolase